MFSNTDSAAIGFDSKNQLKKSNKKEIDSQTDLLDHYDKVTNTALNNSVQCQTSFEPPSSINVDYDKLAEWLKRIYPLVEEQLTNDDQAAFNDYNPESDLGGDSPTKLLLILKEPDHDQSKYHKTARVSSLSWNKTGNTLAVSYSYEHDSICIHDVFIHLYTADRNGDYKEVPTNKLLVPACISSIQYHPTEPSVLIAGCVSGQILLWIPTGDNHDMISTTFSGHNDLITQISWQKKRNTNEYQIISASLDASMLIWDADLHSGVITVKQRYKVNLPKLLNRPILKSERGIRSFAFNYHEFENFVVAVEGGHVLRCSLNGASLLSNDSDEFWYNPVVSQYEGHDDGDVHNIEFSPHRRDLFFSCGADGNVHIYNIDQENPIQIIFSKERLSRAYWIPSSNQMIIGCCQTGKLHLFSLHNGQAIKILEAPELESLTSITFNSKSSNLIAVGTDNGHVQLWNIPWHKITGN